MFYILVPLFVIILGIVAFINFHPVFGGKQEGEILSKMKLSSNFKNEVFKNTEPTPMMTGDGSMFSVMTKFLFGFKNAKPKIIETTPFLTHKFIKNDSSSTLTWFGHSTILLKVNGTTILTDPVFSKNASPVPNINKSFNYSNNNYLANIPDVDIILISHDHYDHLDYKTIKSLNKKTKFFYVPLGVESHLIKWGVPDNKIIVADWWDDFIDKSGIKITATPARHFSGRGLSRNKTLWCSWVIETDNQTLFFGGDSGYGKHFSEIGEKFGPFDLTMLECGQYNNNWKYIHMMPEQTIQAHIDLKGEKLLTTHWGKFKLSLHTWDEPIKRAKAEAIKKGVNLIEPRIGEVFTY